MKSLIFFIEVIRDLETVNHSESQACARYSAISITFKSFHPEKNPIVHTRQRWDSAGSDRIGSSNLRMAAPSIRPVTIPSYIPVFFMTRASVDSAGERICRVV